MSEPKTVDPAKDPREIDVQVASLMYEVRHLKVKWYPLEIVGFYEHGSSLMLYSFDKNACNARMFANGVDERDGYANSLPFYSARLEDFQEIIDYIRRQGGNLSISIEPTNCLVTVQMARSATFAAPAPDGGVTLDNSDIALAGCFAFIEAYR